MDAAPQKHYDEYWSVFHYYSLYQLWEGSEEQNDSMSEELFAYLRQYSTSPLNVLIQILRNTCSATFLETTLEKKGTFETWWVSLRSARDEVL